MEHHLTLNQGVLHPLPTGSVISHHMTSSLWLSTSSPVNQGDQSQPCHARWSPFTGGWGCTGVRGALWKGGQPQRASAGEGGEPGRNPEQDGPRTCAHPWTLFLVNSETSTKVRRKCLKIFCGGVQPVACGGGGGSRWLWMCLNTKS